MKYKYLIGIDEAGRGPLAGPVSVGVCCVREDFNWALIPGVADSKKLSARKREDIFARAEELKKEGALLFSVSMVGPAVIDRVGIVGAVNQAMAKSLGVLQRSGLWEVEHCAVKLDGSLKAPSCYIHQETIIRGDAKEPIIGLASILAKVTRDRYMEKLARHEPYTAYEFEVHKGYGTLRHRTLIKMLGVCDMHRMSFCSKLIER